MQTNKKRTHSLIRLNETNANEMSLTWLLKGHQKRLNARKKIMRASYAQRKTDKTLQKQQMWLLRKELILKIVYGVSVVI